MVAESTAVEFGGFRLGLSQVIRYAYGGLLLALLAALLEPEKTKTTVEALSAPLAITVALGLGAAIYVFHRYLIIPLHHLLLCGILFVFHKEGSPTHFLKTLNVRLGKRRLAYTMIRWSNFFTDKQARDIAHAEGGLLVLTAEGLGLAAWYAGHFQIQPWWPYFIIAIVVYIASFGPAIAQHSWECHVMREREPELRSVLMPLGLINKTDGQPPPTPVGEDCARQPALDVQHNHRPNGTSLNAS